MKNNTNTIIKIEQEPIISLGYKRKNAMVILGLGGKK